MDQIIHLIKYQNKLSRGEICVANFIPPANGTRVVSTAMSGILFARFPTVDYVTQM